MTVRPVILSGGAGTRLWPLSRRLHPKQLLPLASARPMIAETALRLAGDGFASPIVVCNQEHRFIIAEQLREAGVTDARIVLEPLGRNTAPAAALGALLALDDDAEVLTLVVPSDHLIGAPQRFLEAVKTATAAAESGHLVTFGIEPDRPETGYGYIAAGNALDGARGCHAVARFIEKPDQAMAERLLAGGGVLWNSGMFLFRAQTFIDTLAALAPEILSAAREAIAGGAMDLDFFRPDGDAFAASPADSIDYAVMEKTDHAAVVPVDMDWSDIGSWASLWRHGDADDDGNVSVGEVVAEATAGSYLRSEGPLIAVHGVRDLVVVATPDAVLVVPRTEAEAVKGLVERMAADGHDEHEFHPRVHRPWGWYQSVDAGAGFQVKRLYVKPGARLSLQSHKHRAEHWVVVAGTARVTRDEDVLTLTTNQSTYIPAGVRHRLENADAAPLYVVEVQTGDYLGEDDIVRFDDDFARD